MLHLNLVNQTSTKQAFTHTMARHICNIESLSGQQLKAFGDAHNSPQHRLNKLRNNSKRFHSSHFEWQNKQITSTCLTTKAASNKKNGPTSIHLVSYFLTYLYLNLRRHETIWRPRWHCSCLHQLKALNWLQHQILAYFLEEIQNKSLNLPVHTLCVLASCTIFLNEKKQNSVED